MTASVRRAWIAGLLVGAAVVGCDGSSDLRGGGVATVPAKGRIVQADGSPVSGGVITLEPLLDGGSAHQAAGEIQPDGSFELTTVKPKDGATPGKYRVKVESKSVKSKKGPEVQAEVAAGKDLDIKLP